MQALPLRVQWKDRAKQCFFALCFRLGIECWISKYLCVGAACSVANCVCQCSKYGTGRSWLCRCSRFLACCKLFAFFWGGAVHDHVLFFPHTCVSIMFCSRMRSKGSRFTLGVWGLRVCSLDVAFMFATVRGRPCEARMAVPMVSSAKGVTSGGCTCRVASFRVTGVALRDIQTCFVTCRKSFCVAGAILLRRFRKMRCSFCVRRSALDASIVILRGRRSTLDASCCVFVANHIVRAMSSGNKVQFPW